MYFFKISARYKWLRIIYFQSPPCWMEEVNLTNMRHSEGVIDMDAFWASCARSIFILCPGGSRVSKFKTNVIYKQGLFSITASNSWLVTQLLEFKENLFQATFSNFEVKFELSLSFLGVEITYLLTYKKTNFTMSGKKIELSTQWTQLSRVKLKKFFICYRRPEAATERCS